MSTLLIEIGCEELPYKVCDSVIRQLEDKPEASGLARALLEEERLLEADATVRALVSPRRIAVLVEGVPARQIAKTDDYRGPKAEIAYDAEGGLTKAGLGFARSRGAQPEDVRREVFDGIEFAVVRVEAERRAAGEVLPSVVSRLVTGLQIPRGMRWGARPEGPPSTCASRGRSAGWCASSATRRWPGSSTASRSGMSRGGIVCSAARSP